MNKTLVGTGIAIFALLGVAGLFAGTASAYRGDPSVKGPNYTAERHAAMEQAFEAKDYSAWKALMGDRGRVTQVVNAGNFAKFAQMHELIEEGKIAEAQQIREELGLGTGQGKGRGMGMANMGRGMHR